MSENSTHLRASGFNKAGSCGPSQARGNAGTGGRSVLQLENGTQGPWTSFPLADPQATSA